MIRRILIIALCFIMLLSLACCGKPADPSGNEDDPGKKSEPQGGKTAGVFTPYFSSASFDSPEKMKAGVEGDFSHLAQGYAGFTAENKKQVVIQVLCGESKYNYFAPMDGSLFYVPVNMGDGDYEFRVMQNTTDNKYARLETRTFQITMDDEFQPFLRPNIISMYTEESECVKKAAELASKSDSEKDFIRSVYKYVSDNVKYDDHALEGLKEGYIPYPDRTFETGKGICFDYSSLAAAMLRSQGIPTKIITGYVGKDALYHAWNSVYTIDSGWISVEIKVNTDDWTRMDCTFASQGSSQAFSYVDRYVY